MKNCILFLVLVLGLNVVAKANTCLEMASASAQAKQKAESGFQLLVDEINKKLEAQGSDNIYTLYHDAFYGKCEFSSLGKISKAMSLQADFKAQLTALAENSARAYEAYSAELCSNEQYAPSAFYMQVYFAYQEQAQPWTKFVDTILNCLENK